MQKLIILRGAPSSGKSTIAKSLRNIKEKIAWLKVDNFKVFFADDASCALNYVHKSSIATLEYLLSQGFSVIMEGIFQDPKYITLATQAAKRRNIPFKVFELECSLETLQKRDKSRIGIKEGCRKPLGSKVITHLYNVIIENPWNKVVKLNTESMTLEECINILKKEFRN